MTALKFQLLLIASIITVFSQDLIAHNEIDGIEIVDVHSKNIYWKNYLDERKPSTIKSSHNAIKLSVANLSLFEYALMLDRLYEIAGEIPDFQAQWKDYMDSLMVFANKDCINSGLIPMEAAFFHGTLEKNSQLAASDPNLFKFLRKHTPRIEGMGYQPYGCPSPSRNLIYSETYPPEVQVRKKIDADLVSESAEKIDMIRISTGPQKPEERGFFDDLTGTWEAQYSKIRDIKIIIYLAPLSDSLGENSIKGTRRLSHQSRLKNILMRGTFVDKGNYYEIHMEEYKIPWEEERQWFRDLINKEYGGPENFYRKEQLYGFFNLKLDKDTEQMKGVWSSKSGVTVRDFAFSKVEY